MKRKILQFISVMMLATIFITTASRPLVASASPRAIDPEQAMLQHAGAIDNQELEGFFDELLANEMAERHIPGAMVAVVKDGQVLLAKGYGLADLEGEVQVDPEHTLFRMGSISKLFVWKAVMQLVEQDQLSLDSDVNEYLDFAIPATNPEPITLSHLMSHTPGFEFKGTNLWGLEAERMLPLGDWLKANLPERIFPPGEVAAYSNYGTALAGYIVERVSGQPFNEYIEQNIFEPLEMTQSTFRQPLPEKLEPAMAKGYNYTDEYIEGGFMYQLPFPAGSLSSTAKDMARFMNAHLGHGELDGRRILQEETALQMHSQLYTPDPRLKSMAHGFWEHTENGQRLLFHGGDIAQFHSGLWLIPGENVGLFYSTNSQGGYDSIDQVKKAFLNHYFPEAEPPTPPPPEEGFSERIAPYLGQYTSADSNFTTYEKIYGVFSPISASLEGDGSLVIAGVRYAEVEPGLLQEIGEPDNQRVYRPGPDGRLFLMGSEPLHMFRTPWYGGSILHLLLFASGTLLFLGALIAWPIGFFTGRRKNAPNVQPRPIPARLAHWAAAFFGLLWLSVLLGIMSIFMNVLPETGGPRIIYEAVPLLDTLLSLCYVLGALALVMVVFAVLAWVQGYWSRGGRIFYSVLALMALLLTWVLLYWNLLG